MAFPCPVEVDDCYDPVMGIVLLIPALSMCKADVLCQRIRILGKKTSVHVIMLRTMVRTLCLRGSYGCAEY